MAHDDQTLEIKIQARGTKDFSFPKQTKISVVIEKAVSEFGFAPGDNFELMLSTNTDDALQPDRPLVSYGIKDGDILILTSTGSGVSDGS